MSSSKGCFVQPTVQTPDISFAIIEDYENEQIFTFEKLKPENI